MRNIIYSLLLTISLVNTSYSGEAYNKSSTKDNSQSYISISHGKSLYGFNDRLFNNLNSTHSDKKDKSTKVTYGKVLNDNYSVEVSYMNAGQSNLSHVINHATQRTSTLDLNLVYQFASVYNTHFYVKAGPSYAMTSSHNIRTPEANFTMFKEVVNDREVILHTGLGITKNIIGYTIIIEYDKYHSLNSGGDFMLTNTGAGDSTPTRALEGDLETLTMGLKFKF